MRYEEQREIMYRDYVSNIVETGFINGIMQNEYSIEQIKEYIENLKEGNITQDIEKIYSKIEKDYINKEKNIEDIQKYLKEKVIKIVCKKKIRRKMRGQIFKFQCRWIW